MSTPPFYYDGSRYFLDDASEFIPMDTASVKRHLLARSPGLIKLEIDAALCRIQTGAFVHFAGPLAGMSRGVHEASGKRVLVTSGPSIIQAAPGEWPTLRAVLRGLLGGDEIAGEHQVAVFLGWLKYAREAVLAGRRRPGQVLALAGPRGCGKSLLIDLVELALGGRRANPHKYFTGRTTFNADLAGAELLVMDDEAGSTDIRARKNLAAAIKANLFAGAVSVEGKHKDAFSFSPCWRVMIALNDEPEALLVLPPITEDIVDKLTVLRCHRRPLPMPAHTMDERAEFWARLKHELPALLDYLEKHEVAAGLREERCGVAHYHHPAILDALRDLSPEGQLSDLIDAAERAGGILLPWTGTAAELKALLLACSTTGREAEKLLGGWAPAAGSYLARLEGHRAEKLTVRDGIQRWRVTRARDAEQDGPPTRFPF
jgi:hypothetical protein